MKKKLGLLLVLSSVLLLGACGKESGSSSDTIKIGANLELSGAVAAYGDAELQGIKLAVKEINADGGIDGKKIELVSKDNKSDTAEAASVATSLATKDKVSAIVGPATSGAVKASIPAVTRAKVPLVTPSGTDDAVTVDAKNKVQEYIFRTCYQDSFQGITLANYASKELSAKSAIIIGDNSSDYAKGLTKSFKKQFSGKIVDEVNFTSGDKDFQAILTKIKNMDFDVIYLPGYYNEAGLIIKQAREMGITQPILGADGFGDAELIKLADAKNVNDVYYTAHFSTKADATDKTKDFIAAFKKEYNKEPSAFNALGYDSVYLIKKAAEDAKSTEPAKITTALAKVKGFEGVTGTMSIDKDHNPEKAAVVVQLTNGEESKATIVEPK